jgi:hypothetical protein
LRAIHASSAAAPDFDEPRWMAQFLAELARADLSSATVRGYRYDLRHFLRRHHSVIEASFTPQGLTYSARPH